MSNLWELIKPSIMVSFLFIILFSGATPLIHDQMISDQSNIQFATGFQVPTIDGMQALGNTEFLGEWDDAPKLDSILIGLNQPDLNIRQYRKMVGDDLFVGVTAPTDLSLANIKTITLQIDRDHDNGLSAGDVRLVLFRFGFDQIDPKNPSFEQFNVVEGEVYDGMNWFIPMNDNSPVPVTLDWGEISVGTSHQDPKLPVFIEMVAHLNQIDKDISDLYPSNRISHYNALPGQVEQIGYGVTVDMFDGSTFGFPATPVGGDAEPSGLTTVDVINYDVGYIYRENVNIGIDHVELTQSTQTATNDYSIVRGKESLFRVFVDHNQPGKFVKVRVFLRIYGGFGPSASVLYSNSADLIIDDRFNRNRLSDSANFLLSPSITNRTHILYSTYVVPLDSVLSDYDDLDRSNNMVTSYFETVASRDLNVFVVPVNSASYSSPMLHSQTDIDMQTNYLSMMYPTAVVNIFQEDWRMLGIVNADSGAVMSKLNWLYNYLISIRRYQIDAGIPHIRFPHQVHGFTTFGGGEADASWTFGGGSDRVAWSNIGSSGVLTMAHEINHNLGPGYWPEEWRGNWGKHISGEGYGCGAFGGDGVWGGLYGDNFIHDLGWNSRDNLIHSGTPELMTYCNWGDTPPKWLGGYRWERLLTRIQTLQYDRAIVGAHVSTRPFLGVDMLAQLPTLQPGIYSPQVAYTSSIRMITGSITRSGLGILDPSFEMPGIWNSEDTNLTLSNPDALINVKYDNGTSIDIPLIVFGDTPDNSSESSDTHYFSKSIEDNGKISSVSLVNATNGKVMAQQIDSTKSYNVGLQYQASVKQGEEFDVYLILPNDNSTTLYSQLLYSPNGRGWLPLNEPTTGDVISTNLGSYPGGDDSSLQLLVSDGLKTWVVQGATLQVEHKAPKVELNTNDLTTQMVNGTIGSTFSFVARGHAEIDWDIADGNYNWEVLNMDTNTMVFQTFEDAAKKSYYFDKAGTYSVSVEVVDPDTGLKSTDIVKILVLDQKPQATSVEQDKFNDILTKARENTETSSSATSSSTDSKDQNTDTSDDQQVPSALSPLPFDFLGYALAVIILPLINKCRRKKNHCIC